MGRGDLNPLLLSTLYPECSTRQWTPPAVIPICASRRGDGVGVAEAEGSCKNYCRPTGELTSQDTPPSCLTTTSTRRTGSVSPAV